MTFEQARAAALALLTAQGRVKNSELLAAVGGDQQLLASVREDLIFDDLAKDKDGVGLIAVASVAVVTAETPATKPRVFLSYGRRDASEFVDRLCVDLAAAGFDVWRDTREIRSGQDWQTEIVDGLRAAQVVVAVMTPHSVRTTRDASSPDQVDSVCLGEIAFALFQPPPQPIVPVMAQTCEPPLAIFHLDYIDLRAWQDSDDQYRAGVQRLIDGIHSALRGEKRYRSWHHQLNPFDFASFLYAKRSDFCGRQWLFDKLDAWRAASGRERALLIKGDPGVGKSAIVAELVHRNPDGQVLAYHCCQWDHGETLKPGRFVRSLAAMIASKVEGYADLLQHDPTLQDALTNEKCESDPGSALEAGVFTPLERLPAPSGGPRYILIDALDEALLAPPGSGTIVNLLASRLDRLPGWLRIVATTRKDPRVLSHLGGLRAEEIDTHSADNQDDLRLFLDQHLATPNLSEVLTHARLAPAQVRDELLLRSAGNFLYVRQALEALELRQLDPRQLNQLPPGMAGLYAHRFERLFPSDADFAGPKRVFEALAAAQEPLSANQLSAITELDEDEALPALMTKLATYVPPRVASDGQVRYSFFHKSLSDWLTTADRRGLPHSVNPKSGHRRLADLGWREYTQQQPGERGALSPYSLRHLPTHLLETERWDDVARLLTDLSYLEAKTTAGHVFSLAVDLSRAAARLPRSHPQQRLLPLLDEALRRDIHFIDLHAQDYPQALFQCLWNSGWWYDCPEAANHYVPPQDGWKHLPPWERENLKLCDLLTEWRVQREHSTPGFPWLRTLRPPSIHLGTAQRAVLRGHREPVNCVSFSPDGTRIVSGSNDWTLRVWDAESGAELSKLRGHCGGVNSVTYSPDGTRIVSGSYDRTLRVWDAESGAVLSVLRGHDGDVNCVSYSPDGTRIVSSSEDETLRVWNAVNGAEVSVLRGHIGYVLCGCYSPDGKRIVSGSMDKTLRVWDAESGAELSVMRGHEDLIFSLSFSLDGKWIASGSKDKTLRVWDAASGEEVSVMREPGQAVVTSVSYSPNGKHIISGSYDKTVCVWDAVSGVLVSVLRGHEGPLRSVNYSPNGTRIVSGSKDNTLRLWDAESGAELSVLRGHESFVTSLSYSPDGTQIVSGSKDKTLRAWDAESGEELFVLRGHYDAVKKVNYSRDGVWIVSGSRDETLRVWDTQTFQCLQVLRGSSWTDVAPIALGSREEFWHTVVRNFETVVEAAANGCLIARFPEQLWAMGVSPSGRAWAGGVGSHLQILQLEGPTDRRPDLSSNTK